MGKRRKRRKKERKKKKITFFLKKKRINKTRRQNAKTPTPTPIPIPIPWLLWFWSLGIVDIELQFNPFPSYPSLQTHSKPPWIFLQVACSSHPPLFVKHSLMSILLVMNLRIQKIMT